MFRIAAFAIAASLVLCGSAWAESKAGKPSPSAAANAALEQSLRATLDPCVVQDHALLAIPTDLGCVRVKVSGGIAIHQSFGTPGGDGDPGGQPMVYTPAGVTTIPAPVN